MEKNSKNNSKKFCIVIVILTLIIATTVFTASIIDENIQYYSKIQDSTLNILASSENQDLEEVVKSYAYSKGYDVNIEYAGTLDIMQKLNENSKNYDAVWVSNSIWLYMLDSSIKIDNSKYTSINPVIFGINKSKAQELGFIGKTIYTQDIVDSISSGKLKFSMSNPTSTNSGASAYLGLLYTLAGNPEVLKEEDLQNEELKTKLTKLFTGMERSSGSEDFLEEMFLKGDYEAVVTYESSIINMNKKLQQQGKEPLYAIYPVDGVSISDSPLAYINNKNDRKKEIFNDIQGYILSDEGQSFLQQKGRRTWYGGISNTVDKKIFNPDWGIDTNKYISPVKYPSTAVIKSALNVYQTELRKPVHVVFCLDYSGSMISQGYDQLLNAMNYILTDKAKEDFIQFAEKDKVDVIPFGTKVLDKWTDYKGNDTAELLEKIQNTKPTGSTALYPAAIEALNLLKTEDQEKYNTSVILMTDGQANVGSFRDLKNEYNSIKKNIPIYSITFGSADEYELQDIATLTNAKIFNGKTDLVKAFKEVRGYN